MPQKKTRLIPHSAITKARKRLAAHYSQLAETESQKGPEGYQRLDDDRTQMMQALQDCAAQKQWQSAKSLAWSIRSYLDIQGYSTELVIVNQTGVEIGRQLEDRREESAWLGNLGAAYRALGEMEKAIVLHSKSLEINKEISNRQAEVDQLGNLCLAYHDLGEVEKAVEYLQKALVIFEEIKSPYADMTRQLLAELKSN